ncbi:outer membrane beta-barrel protein [Dokdonia sp.]|uniref:outer membrane beta-barrel protein n=1 Tax=Dokdonia sp. TaxID=2024995 RepID=UPI00326756D2
MKTILYTCLLLITTISMQAQDVFNQTAEGNWLANGTARIFSTSSKAKLDGNTNKIGSTFEVQAGPKVGYFIIDDLAIGLEVFVSLTSTNLEGVSDNVNTNALFVGPFARYYVYQGFFGEATVGIGGSKTTTNIIGEQKSNIFGWRLTGGYNIALGNHISLEPTINYSWENQKPKDAGDFTPSTVISSFFVGIGFTAFL